MLTTINRIDNFLNNNTLHKSDLGLKVLTKYDVMPIENLLFNEVYQREIEPPRTKKLYISISKHGYWPNEVIILNERYEIIDGQHRVLAAKQCGIKQLPVTVFTFPDKIKEAAFFKLKNSFNPSLKPTSYFGASFKADDAYAKLLYELTWIDQKSLLLYKCKLKENKTKEAIFSITDVAIIINYIGLNHRDIFKKDREPTVNKIVNNTPYVEIRNKINKFVLWFFESFGEKTKENKQPYKSKTLRSIVVFYNALERAKYFNSDKEYKRSIEKFKSFKFQNEFHKFDHIAQIMTLVNHFNKGKKDKFKYYS